MTTSNAHPDDGGEATPDAVFADLEADMWRAAADAVDRAWPVLEMIDEAERTGRAVFVWGGGIDGSAADAVEAAQAFARFRPLLS